MTSNINNRSQIWQCWKHQQINVQAIDLFGKKLWALLKENMDFCFSEAGEGQNRAKREGDIKHLQTSRNTEMNNNVYA